MVMDIGLVGIIILFALHGFGQGFMRGLTSLVAPLLGIWLALRHCDALAALIDPLIHNQTVSVVASFLLILAGIWLAIRLARRLLAKLVDWSRCWELDQFLGGVLGLAKGTALIWLLLALSLTIFPQSVRVIEKSKASVRLLSIGEKLGGDVIAQGEDALAGLEENFQGLEGTLSLFRQLNQRQAFVSAAELPD